MTFAQVGLAIETSDRGVWRFAQERSLLLTDNRNMDEVEPGARRCQQNRRGVDGSGDRRTHPED